MREITEIQRRTPEEITELARDAVTGRKCVTDDEHVIRSAFYMMLAFIPLSEAAVSQIGALIGDYADVVPARAMNGYPIFLSVGFLHRDDVPAYNAERRRMHEALGLDD